MGSRNCMEDISTDWMSLEDLKRSNPVGVAEYAKARNIDKEVVFHWWVPYVLKKREMIISQVTSRMRRTSHKHGIDVPEMTSKLDMPEMASTLDMTEMASKLDIPEMANKLDVPEMASKLDMPEMVSKLDMPEMASKLNNYETIKLS